MYEVYCVEMGDTLSSIAKKYGISESELEKINGIHSDYRTVSGGLLVVPVRENKKYQYYTVKKGDTISKIASDYGVDYNLLLLLNGLDPDDYIYPNQSVMLPADGMEFYVVRENDTLNGILKKIPVTVEELLKDNDKIYLREGQLIGFSKK